MAILRQYEGWDTKCVDYWNRYYAGDVVESEIGEMDTLIRNIENALDDDERMAYYHDAVDFLEGIYLRKFIKNNPDIKLIDLRRIQGCEEMDTHDQVIECGENVSTPTGFGITVITYEEVEE